MSRTIAIVPIRGRLSGKSRLAPLFSDAERACIIERMAWHVVSTIQSIEVVDLTVIVSREGPFTFAEPVPGSAVHSIVQPDHVIGLNGALDVGRNWAREHGADRLLVMSADLPLLEPDDVLELLDRQAPVVLAPDRWCRGTNALMLGESNRTSNGVMDRFAFQFGSSSLMDHVAGASRLGVAADTVSAPGTGFDLDTPDDWCRLPGHVHHRLLGTTIEQPDEERSGRRASSMAEAAWMESA